MENPKVNEHIENTLSGEGKRWVREFVDWMREHYPELEEVISFQMPTFKLGSGANRHYLSFHAAKEHFSFHTMDFDFIDALRTKLAKPGKGKGCVQVRFDDEQGKQVLFSAIPELIQRAGQ